MYNFNYNLPDGFANGSFRQQFKTNGSEYVGVTLQIPVFNRFATRNAVRESRLNIKNEKLQLLNARQNILKRFRRLMPMLSHQVINLFLPKLRFKHQRSHICMKRKNSISAAPQLMILILQE